MSTFDAESRISMLERQLRVQRRLLVGVSLLGGIVALGAFKQQTETVIRARGIVIVDDKGRERILIGAPIPEARSRVRTDLKRVEQIWATRFADPKAYMGFYATYRHSMHGMLVLDENGFDRLAIGDSTPDPNTGKRIGAGPSIDITDANGFERSGWGMLTVGGKDRVTFGIDNRDGEAITLTAQDGGKTGLSVNGTDRRSIFLGVSPAEGPQNKRDSASGLVIKKGSRDAHRLSTEDVPPAR